MCQTPPFSLLLRHWILIPVNQIGKYDFSNARNECVRSLTAALNLSKFINIIIQPPDLCLSMWLRNNRTVRVVNLLQLGLGEFQCAVIIEKPVALELNVGDLRHNRCSHIA